jgi:hypothetical protein
MAKYNSNTIIKFADDTTVITDNNKTAYREEVRDLAVLCQDNNFFINVSKTKVIVDYRKKRADQATINIDGAVVERVESFKFLGVHFNNKLTWFKHTWTVVKRAQQNRFPFRRQTFWHGSSDPQKVLQLHHREHPDWLHHCLVLQMLGLHPQGTTEGSANGRVHHWSQASCHPGPIN